MTFQICENYDGEEDKPQYQTPVLNTLKWGPRNQSVATQFSFPGNLDTLALAIIFDQVHDELFCPSFNRINTHCSTGRNPFQEIPYVKNTFRVWGEMIPGLKNSEQEVKKLIENLATLSPWENKKLKNHQYNILLASFYKKVDPTSSTTEPQFKKEDQFRSAFPIVQQGNLTYHEVPWWGVDSVGRIKGNRFEAGKGYYDSWQAGTKNKPFKPNYFEEPLRQQVYFNWYKNNPSEDPEFNYYSSNDVFARNYAIINVDAVKGQRGFDEIATMLQNQHDTRLANVSSRTTLPVKENTTIVCGTSLAQQFDPSTGGGICKKYCSRSKQASAYYCAQGSICNNLYEYYITDTSNSPKINFGYYRSPGGDVVLYLKEFFMIPGAPTKCIREENCYFHKNFVVKTPGGSLFPHMCCWTEQQARRKDTQTQILTYAQSVYKAKPKQKQFTDTFEFSWNAKPYRGDKPPNYQEDSVLYNDTDDFPACVQKMAILSLGKTFGDMGQIIEVRRQFLNYCQDSGPDRSAVPYFLTYDLSCGALANLWEVPTLLQKLEKDLGEGLIAYKPPRAAPSIEYGPRDRLSNGWKEISKEQTNTVKDITLSDLFGQFLESSNIQGDEFDILLIPHEIVSTNKVQLDHEYTFPVTVLWSKFSGKDQFSQDLKKSESDCGRDTNWIPYYYLRAKKNEEEDDRWEFYFCLKTTLNQNDCFENLNGWQKIDTSTQQNLVNLCKTTNTIYPGKPGTSGGCYIGGYAVEKVALNAPRLTNRSSNLETMQLYPMYIFESASASKPVASRTRSGGGGSKKRRQFFGSRKRRKSRPKAGRTFGSRKRRKSRKARGKRKALKLSRKRRKSKKSKYRTK